MARYWSTSIDAGLSSGEAERRLARLGPNKLAEGEGPKLWQRLLAQVSDFTVLALLAAAALAAGLSIVAPEPGASLLARFGDSVAILLIVVLNAILGLIQEKPAEDALRALRDMTAPNAHARRDVRPKTSIGLARAGAAATSTAITQCQRASPTRLP